ncbi:MAG: AraC family transcriptional regulator [Lachnospiraceae bacterium]|nr:AraC family transcriptional regulator [Lachnospiraceae bacterium]
MHRNLDGIHETVNYRADTEICLYYNNEYENYPTHWHNTFEIIMPVIGTYRVVCGDRDYHLREGDILIICPCMLHELFAPPTGERIIFQPGISQLNIKELNLLVAPLRPAFLITSEKYPEIHPGLQQLMMEIKEEYFSTNAYSTISVTSKFLEFLVRVGRAQTSPGSSTNAAGNAHRREYVEKFIYITDYIDNNFAENLSLEKVASLAGFSKYHFTRLFKQYTNTSFYKYLNARRIDHAKTMLMDPQLSVTEVALQSGFSSLSAFLRMFKQMTQCTPTEFRSMYGLY